MKLKYERFEKVNYREGDFILAVDSDQNIIKITSKKMLFRYIYLKDPNKYRENLKTHYLFRYEIELAAFPGFKRYSIYENEEDSKFIRERKAEMRELVQEEWRREEEYRAHKFIDQAEKRIEQRRRETFKVKTFKEYEYLDTMFDNFDESFYPELTQEKKVYYKKPKQEREEQINLLDFTKPDLEDVEAVF